jgi:hypothetical protein
VNKSSILILGGRSDIGLAVAYRFALKGYSIQLAARNYKDLEVYKSDIELRHAVKVSIHEFDAIDVDSHQTFASSLPFMPDIIICAIGLLGGQSDGKYQPYSAIEVMQSNFIGPANIIGIFANIFEERGSGVIVGISSVAGDRGRASNFVYGSGKAGFSAFLSGLRNRLAKKGVHVITILPGFVDTRMTDGMKLPRKLTAQTSDVARVIENAIQKKQNVVYVKTIWRLIMFIIKSIPEGIFKLMKL